MFFNSLEFIIFLPTVFCLYWFGFSKSLQFQNLLLLFSSYIFYGWWDWRFLSLIFLSTFVDYFVGKKIYKSKDIKVKRTHLWMSILFNLSLLGIFKYFDFFIDSLVELLGVFGYEQKSNWTLNIILPVGISFYTFQTMSYSLDIYYGKLKPTKNFISFATFVGFFPQLVAGPIERASNLLPQMLNVRTFNYKQVVEGSRLILWGMFKKIVIADSLAPLVDTIFQNYNSFNGGILFLGLIYFSFQIYCDFSGYSDIAIGTAKLFGFELMSNFKFPYFSKNIGEFWKKWHVSLSTWFRDYLYIPLGGSRAGKWISLRNIFIVFIISGFWHGANWTFVIWGLIHAVLYVLQYLIENNKKYIQVFTVENKWIKTIKDSIQMIFTFLSVTIAWVFFRGESISKSLNYLNYMISNFTFPASYRIGLLSIIILLFIELMAHQNERNLFQYHRIKSRRIKKLLRFITYYILSLCVFTYFIKSETSFIYFQF